MAAVKVHKQALSIESIINAKNYLKTEQLLDPDVSACLDYAKEKFSHMPAEKFRRAQLFVEGKNILLKFYKPFPGNPNSFTVRLKSGRPELRQRVIIGAELRSSDIVDHHFRDHSCRDETNPCFEQARHLLCEEGQKNSEIWITCNDLCITFATAETDSKVCSKKVQPSLKFRNSNSSGIRDILRVKCWLERETPEKNGLLACVKHLLTLYIENAVPQTNSDWVLQGDGETLELICNVPFKNTFYLFHDTEGVSMFPSLKKQCPR